MSDAPTDLWVDEDGLVRRTVTDGPDLLAGLRNGTWLDKQNFPPLRWAVDGLIPEGFSLFAGPPKVGKSWLSLALALAVAAGGRALGRIRVQRRPVLLLALEDGNRRLQDRARTLLGPDEPIPGRLNYLTRIDPGTLLGTLAAWLEIHGSAEPLVVLDTLGKIKPPAQQGESAYQHDYRVGSALKRACDEWPGTSLLVVHHVRKAAADDFVDGISGTNGLAGAADSIITLSRARHDGDGLLKVTGRDVIEREYAMTFDGGTWTLDGTTLDEAAAAAEQNRASEGLSDRSTEIIRIVAECPDIGPTAVAAKLGIDAKDAGQYLGRLVNSGRLSKVGRGRYRVVTSGFDSFDGFDSAVTDGEEDSPTGPPTPVEPVENVETPCERCQRPAAELVLGRCRSCAYPIETDEGDQDA